jgi:hypothetical protein
MNQKIYSTISLRIVTLEEGRVLIQSVLDDINRRGFVPIWWIGSVGSLELKVAVCLSAHLNQKSGVCNPSVEAIADYVGLEGANSARNIRRALRGLQRRGVIDRIETRPGKSLEHTKEQHHQETGVTPVEWTLSPLGRKGPPCQNHVLPTHRSFRQDRRSGACRSQATRVGSRVRRL